MFIKRDAGFGTIFFSVISRSCTQNFFRVGFDNYWLVRVVFESRAEHFSKKIFVTI